ncbi:MAG: Type II secretion system protein E [Methanomicrobiales archaeon 53_19]|uniref:type II/IV secretion system ATPase subunit n=1 Tax=Methanocalculus sp. TaxID=2004547 RepID=UPI00074938DB|nr:type II/IV secretion system ATPase subunit [Methanocalculus sp.]KUL00800.1 MAG: Type II secretion system protein E [Methanomicrobiales archaeon 53_19]HIJ06451.1 type II/IV secretion system ATPase subunit [Methanocalculus sp.]
MNIPFITRKANQEERETEAPDASLKTNTYSIIPPLIRKTKKEQAGACIAGNGSRQGSLSIQSIRDLTNRFFSKKEEESDEGIIDIPPLPDLPEDLSGECLERYWLTPPHAWAAIMQERWAIAYHIIEPSITPHEHILLEEVHHYLRDIILYESPGKRGEMNISDKDIRNALFKFDPLLVRERKQVLTYMLKRTFQGYGRLDPLMHDEAIEDISCNGAVHPVFIFHRRYGSIPTQLIYGHEELNRFVLKLAQKANKSLSLSTPLVDASLPNGSRIQISYSDVISTQGSSFTVRKFRKDPMTPVHLLSFGTFSAQTLAILWLCIENRMNMLIVGGTASGKTSTMNALSFFIPENAKIVSLEDTREIQLPHKNWLPTRTRESGNRDGFGDINLFSLLRASLRQRPEYILVGEVRGQEAQTLFQAMNTGHTTYSTLHAGTVDEAINRLINEPISVAPAMLGALELVVIQGLHYHEGLALRRCDSVHEIHVGGRDSVITWNTILTYNPSKDLFVHEDGGSLVLDKIRMMRGWSEKELKKEIAVRKECLERLAENSIFDQLSVSEAIKAVRRGENA